MHGVITIDLDGARHSIVLEDERAWSVAPPLPAADAARVHPALDRIVASYGGPSGGAFGPGQVREAANYLRLYYPVASVVAAALPDEPRGRVY